MQQIAGASMFVCMGMAKSRLGLKRVPVLNAVGKPGPLRGKYGQREQHVFEPAEMHWGNHLNTLQLK